jgi:hypothetical protein
LELALASAVFASDKNRDGRCLDDFGFEVIRHHALGDFAKQTEGVLQTSHKGLCVLMLDHFAIAFSGVVQDGAE